MSDSASACTCATGHRRLVVISPHLEIEFPELVLFGRHAEWEFLNELDALVIPFGDTQPTTSLTEFVNFLRGLLDVARLRTLRATWLDLQRPVEKQLVKLIHAGSLVGMVSHDSQDLIDILYRKRIETWYQPIRHLETGRVWGYECLLRGRTESGELISPVELIEWAKRENLVFMLDRLSRETHLENAGRTVPDLDSTKLLINYLPSSIYRPEFCLRSTSAAANRAQIKPANVIFEVVETESITDMDHLNSVLSHYRKVGFGVALDDVGSGFSSLNVLAKLEPDLIKVNMTLVQGARDSDISQDICRALVELGHAGGTPVIAEGIETEDDLAFARGIGVDLVQGFHIGRPSPKIAG